MAATEGMKKSGWVSVIYGVILALLFSVSLYIRVVLPYASVFSGPFVRFGGNDPWYTMRIVENTLHNFPHRIWYDAFTTFPLGGHNPFAPLYDYVLSIIIWSAGRGDPFATLGQQGIDVIGAWFPAVLGAATVIPVYLIGKEMYNRNVGVLAAGLIAILPGQFLSRSMLGFTDHDIGGILLLIFALYFLILALRHAKENQITFGTIKGKDWAALKKPVTYTIFTGLTFGLFMLEWVGGMMFGYVFFGYIIIQYIIDHLRGESTDYLCIIGVPVYVIAIGMIAPFLHPGSVEPGYVITSIAAVCAILIMSGISTGMVKKDIPAYAYPLALIGTALGALVLLKIATPALYSQLTGILDILTASPGELTIAEAHPMQVFSSYTGRIADGEAWQWFTTTFFIALAAFPLIGYNIARRFRPEEILLLVWSAVILIGCFGQNRFAFFYAGNVALLCGLVAWTVIAFVGFRGEEGIAKGKAERAGKKVKGKMKGGPREKTAGKNKSGTKTAQTHQKGATTKREKIKRYVRVELIFTIFIICVVMYYPPLNTTLARATSGGGPEYDWYESLSWMKNNTPEPGISYYDLYEEPPLNVTTKRRENYSYPEEAYGVMSWWDYGHWITRMAHRIPNANPFQWGIGGPGENGTIIPGACMFLTSTDEEEANWILDELDTRYVVSDFMMTDAWNSYYNKFGAITNWAGRGYPNYYQTMEIRLHMFDGASELVDGQSIPALQQYRLVHESPTFILPLIIMNETTGNMYWRSFSGDYATTAGQAQILHGHLFSFNAVSWLVDELNNETLPEFLVSAFNSSGIPLSAQSTVAKVAEGQWAIRDQVNNNVFIIKEQEGMLDAYLYGVQTGQPNIKAWTPEYIQPVSFVKVFEYVPGAHITGAAHNGSVVQISTDVTTNQGRTFTYALETVSDGTYEFILPYATEGPVEGGTNFDVTVSPYAIRAGHYDYENETMAWDVEQELRITDEDVMTGRTITLDLL
jgi:dolichyl-diphosphooligosaccharide--protein glycosyltransferase